MPRHARIRFSLAHRITAASVATAGAAALAITMVPGSHAEGSKGQTVSAAPASFTYATNQSADAQRESLDQQYWAAHHQWWLHEQQQAKAAAAQAAAAKAAAQKAAAQAAAAKAAVKPAAAPNTANGTSASGSTAPTPGAQSYPNNLDGWIRHALAIMAANHIPGTYNGIYRNVMRESSGNPNAINLTDSNAAAGHPSKGLLQTIQSTFDTYHVAGTSWNIYDPVANLVAACNYAYHVYGSIDNVNGPY